MVGSQGRPVQSCKTPKLKGRIRRCATARTVALAAVSDGKTKAWIHPSSLWGEGGRKDSQVLCVPRCAFSQLSACSSLTCDLGPKNLTGAMASLRICVASLLWLAYLAVAQQRACYFPRHVGGRRRLGRVRRPLGRLGIVGLLSPGRRVHERRPVPAGRQGHLPGSVHQQQQELGQPIRWLRLALPGW